MNRAAADPLPTAPDGRRAAVIHHTDLPMLPFEPAGPTATHREPIDHRTDCHQLIQRVLHLAEGTTEELSNEESDDILYLIEGAATAKVDDREFALTPGTALFVPKGATYRFNVTSGQRAQLLSVLSPPPARNHEMGRGGAERGVGRGLAALRAPATLRGGPPPATVHERHQPRLTAGEDRNFKLLIDPTHGCTTVTQFVGFIERSRAPYHTHTYEEVIYILGGEGVVHIDDRHVPIHAGTSIFLPPGVPHCLENVSQEVLRLLGVFSPPGSPANKMGPTDLDP